MYNLLTLTLLRGSSSRALQKMLHFKQSNLGFEINLT
jgi:hypothetical protein